MNDQPILSTGGKLLPAPEPRAGVGYPASRNTFLYIPGGGTGREANSLGMGPGEVGTWLSRWRRWRDAFEHDPGPSIRKYWPLWRNFDNTPSPGPGQQWRDRTLIPEPFKLIETRLPRLILGLFGGPESFAVEGRGYQDEQYEELVKQLLKEAFDEIGRGDPRAMSFYATAIEGMRYEQIMGHCWWKMWWRRSTRWVKTKVPNLSQAGKWDPVELLELVYDNIDFRWIDLGSIACDVTNANRWKIERIKTSLEAMIEESTLFERENKMPLYTDEVLRKIEDSHIEVLSKEGYEEPRDTEHWPLDEVVTRDPSERRVELWLCWDNISRTLTKIANRNVLMVHGLSPTPDGLDPYLGSKAVPVPGKVYGDSIFNWTGPLHNYQNRIARARGDEVMMNIWQQYIYREGAVRSMQMFFVPGGAIPIKMDTMERPISDNFQQLQRRPVFTEAYTEESYRQQQAEATAGADAVSQGVEATQKSRDVTATEVQQRLQSVGTRYQLELLYKEVSFKKPLLQMAFDLLRQNLTNEKQVRVIGDQPGFTTIDLRQLDRPIDIVVGGGLFEPSAQDAMNELREVAQYAVNPIFQPYFKPHEFLVRIAKATRTLKRNPDSLFKTDQEVQALQMQQQMMAAGGQPGAGGAPGQPSLTGGPTEATNSLGPGAQGAPDGPLEASATSAPEAEEF